MVHLVAVLRKTGDSILPGSLSEKVLAIDDGSNLVQIKLLVLARLHQIDKLHIDEKEDAKMLTNLSPQRRLLVQDARHVVLVLSEVLRNELLVNVVLFPHE
jgi:hypothetical protein